jgi:hypothetical protein
MSMSQQQKRERAAKVHALGLRGSDALKAVIAELMALGELDLAKGLGAAQVMWRNPIAQRVNELEGFVPRRRPLIDNSERVQELRGEYAARPGLARALTQPARPNVRKVVKPRLSIVPRAPRTRSTELPDAS